MEKKYIKRVTTVTALLATLSFVGYPSVSAKENSSTNTQETSGYADVNANTTSEVMTFDQIVDEMAKNEHITKKEASDIIISGFEQTTPSKTKNGSTALAQSTMSPEIQAQLASYRTMSSQFTVTSSYKPTLKFYCQTDESGSFRAIKKILNVSMDRSYNGTSKQFGGEVYTNLEDPNRIYWIVSGDFYNNGTTTFNGSVSIGLGQSDSVTFGISHASNHYSYCYKTGYYRF